MLQEAKPKPEAHLSVIVVNYRTPELTIGCLESVAAALQEVDARVVVVDNCSADGSPEKIRAWLNKSSISDRSEIIVSPMNSGFSGGNNLGVNAVKADFYLLLNSDARLKAGGLSALLACALSDPSVGAAAPRLVGHDGEIQRSAFRFMTPLSEFMESAASSPLSKLLKQHEIAYPPPQSLSPCDWASFACILLRREAIEDVGPLDEGYFMYFEDADYCWRLQKAGWRIVYEPAASVVHLRGGSSPVKSAMASGARPPAYYYASRTRYFRKLYGPLGPVAANVMWCAGRFLARLRPLFGKKTPRICDGQGADIWLNWRDPYGDPHAPGDAS